LLDGLGLVPTKVYRGVDYMAVLEHERQVRDLRPDFRLLAELDCRGVIVTAQGADSDFVSRFFAPRAGIDEDPVTGSAHCALTPYWAGRLGRQDLTGRQLSVRGGEIGCQLVTLADGKQRVHLSGNCVTYMVADLIIGDGPYDE
jgi:PhzF family phenazine biosynthesis protein